MAYVDRQSGTQRAASLASAAIIQGAIGVVLIYGLATTYVIEPRDKPLGATEFTLPTPPPTEEPTREKQKTESYVAVPDPKLDTVISDPVFTTKPPETTDNQVVRVIDPPYIPPVSQVIKPPLFTAKGPRPAGNQSRWVTTSDYPSADIRGEHSGTSRYRVVISTRGEVTSCEIIQSSGWPGLDRAACANVSKRAKFEPGIDENGAKAVGTYTGSVIWRIPE